MEREREVNIPTENKQERIIDKIRKVLELSKNNPSQEEAKSAALTAQKLMAQYHISMEDVEDMGNVEDIDEVCINVPKGSKWKYFLANVISRNFRCKHYWYGKMEVAFYGYKTDAEIAAKTFEYLFETGNRLANNYYNRARRDALQWEGTFYGKGIKNNFLSGYINGIKESLERQCTALMIVVPKEVNEGYEEKTKDFYTVKHELNLSGCNDQGKQGYNAGIRAGKDTMNSRKIEGGN
jgi:hypothetical protein